VRPDYVYAEPGGSRTRGSHLRCDARRSAFADYVSRSDQMLDAIMLAIGIGLFAASLGYVLLCDRL